MTNDEFGKLKQLYGSITMLDTQISGLQAVKGNIEEIECLEYIQNMYKKNFRKLIVKIMDNFNIPRL